MKEAAKAALLVVGWMVLGLVALPPEVEARDCSKCNRWGACQTVKRGAQNCTWYSVPGIRRCRAYGGPCPKGRDKGNSVIKAGLPRQESEVLVAALVAGENSPACSPMPPRRCRIPNGAPLSSCGEQATDPAPAVRYPVPEFVLVTPAP